MLLITRASSARRVLRHAVAFSTAIFCVNGSARADNAPARECIDAHANGQVARGHGSLLQARAYFRSCAVESCPQVIREDCARFNAEVEASLPSVVVVAQSSNGADVPSATLSLDDTGESVPVDGRAISLDPGTHVFKLQTPSGQRAASTLVIREGEKYRRVVVQLAAPATLDRSPTAPRAGISPLVFVFGGSALLGAGAFTYFAFDGRDRENQLDKCAPDCARSDVSAMRRSYVAADVSLGVAVASLGLGTYFLLRSSGSHANAPSTALSFSANPELSALRVQAATEF